MIERRDLTELIRSTLPDADVEVVDRTGTMDHFNLTVRSQAFAGKTLIEQHQLVYGALRAALADGRVHAVELKTLVRPGESAGPEN
jgi:stress-induced morphogen